MEEREWGGLEGGGGALFKPGLHLG